MNPNNKIKFFKLFQGSEKEPLVKVYSHPRSGTHFLEAFLAKNFYPNQNLSLSNVTWGHWSNRLVNTKGNLYGKLFGNHYFAESNHNDQPKIYIVRDGRAVAYSVWKTPNFRHKDQGNLSFTEFLTTPIDWYGTPSKKVTPTQTILQHWASHVLAWQQLAQDNPKVLTLRYEDLINHPYQTYLKIHNRFFESKPLLDEAQLDVIKKPVGLLPNQGTQDAWKTVFGDMEMNYYRLLIEKSYLDLYKEYQ